MHLKHRNSSKNEGLLSRPFRSLPLTLMAIAGLVAIIVLLIPGCTVQYSITLSQDDITGLAMEEALQSVVQVVTEGGRGSGVLLSPVLVLTAAHVVYPEGEQEPGSGILLTGSVLMTRAEGVKAADFVCVYLDLRADLAILSLKTPEDGINVFGGSQFGRLLSIAEDRLLRVGRKMFVAGHPLGVQEPHLTEGRVTDIDDHGYLRFSAFSYFGNSGGPAFIIGLDGKPVIVAIVQLLTVDGMGLPVGHLALGANPDTIRNFLTNNGLESFVK